MAISSRNPTPYGDPVQFFPIDDEHIYFLAIQNDALILGESPHQKNMQFWAELQRKYENAYKQHRNKHMRLFL